MTEMLGMMPTLNVRLLEDLLCTRIKTPIRMIPRRVAIRSSRTCSYIAILPYRDSTLALFSGPSPPIGLRRFSTQANRQSC